MPPLPRETPHDFLVTEQFLATPFASGAYARNEDPDKDEVSQLICAGEKVRADPEAWKGTNGRSTDHRLLPRGLDLLCGRAGL